LVIGITACVTVETVILPAILTPCAIIYCVRVIITNALITTLACATAIPAVPIITNVTATHTIDGIGSLAIIASEGTICAIRILVDD
jgi:hypothetical protein